MSQKQQKFFLTLTRENAAILKERHVKFSEDQAYDIMKALTFQSMGISIINHFSLQRLTKTSGLVCTNNLEISSQLASGSMQIDGVVLPTIECSFCQFFLTVTRTDKD